MKDIQQQKAEYDKSLAKLDAAIKLRLLVERRPTIWGGIKAVFQRVMRKTIK